MKKVIFIILVGILLCSSVFSQTIETGIWQCQNPNIPSNSEMLIFGEGSFLAGARNLVTGEDSQVKGTYQISGNTVTLTADNQKFVIVINWINKNKFAIANGRGGYLYYAQVTTVEDQFLINYMNGQSGGYSTGSYSAPQGQSTCTICYGTKSCNVCKGTKVTSYYGYSNPCSACNQTGKCWNCNGTGVK